MKLTFYIVNVDGADGMEGEIATTTLERARTVRRAQSHPYGEVTKIVTSDLPLRDLAVAIFNREGYSAESVRVLPPVPERRRDDD